MPIALKSWCLNLLEPSGPAQACIGITFSYYCMRTSDFYIVCLFIQLRSAALRLIVRSWLDVPTFATRHLHACHHTGALSFGRWNCGLGMSGNFAEMTTSTPFRDLLHAVKLRHRTDGFTSLPKEGVLRIFSP
jgi:hypothetical protein